MDFSILSIYIVLGLSGIALMVIAGYFMRNRLKGNPFLITIGIAWGASWFSLIIVGILNDINSPYKDQGMVFATYTSVVIFFAAYLYYEALLTVNPPIWRFTIFFTGFLFQTGFHLLVFLGILSTNTLIVITYFWSSVAALFAMYVILKTLQYNKHNAVKIDFLVVLTLFIGSILYQIHGYQSLLGTYALFTPLSTFVYGISAAVMLLAIFFLVLNSYLYGDYIHFLPVQVYSILVYNRGGLLVYFRNTKPTETNEFQVSEELISGALLAFSNFFQDILGTHAKLSYINATSYKFLISSLPEEYGTITLLTSRANYFITKSLKKFTRLIPKEILLGINKAGIEKDMDKQIDELVKEHFPYLDFKKVLN